MEFDHSSLPRSRPRPRSAVEPQTQFLSPLDPSLSSYSFPPAPRTADGLGSFTQSTPSLSFSSPPKSPVFDFSFEPPMLSHFLSPEDRCDTPTEEPRPRYEAYQFSPPKPRREETNNLQFTTLGQAVYDGRDASEILSSFSFSKILNPLSIRQDRSPPPPPPSAGLHPDKCRLSPHDAVPPYYRAAVSPRDLARVEPTFESPVERTEPQSSRYSFPSPLSNSHHSPSWPELPPPEPHRYYRGGDHEDSTFAPPREYEPTFAKPKLGPPISIVPSSSTSSSSISSYDSHTSSSKRSYAYSLPVPPPHHLHHRSPSPQTSRKKKKNHKTCPSSSNSVPNNRSVVGLYRPSPQSMLAPEAVREVTINLGPSSLSLTPPKPKSARIKHTTTTTTGEGGGGVVGQTGGRAWNAPTLPEGIDFESLPTKNSRGRKPPTFSSTVPASSSSSTLVEDESENRRGTGGRVEDGSKGKKRQWVCQVKECGKTFKRGEHLQRHVRSIHTGEKPFQCQWPQCGKYFSRHDNLNQHLRVHKDSNWTDEEFSSRIRECFDRRLVEVEREAAEIARENAERAKRERRGEEVGNEEGEGSRIGYTPMALPSLIEDQTTTTNTPIVDPGRFRRRGDGDEERERKKRRIDSRTNVRDYTDSSDELLDDDDEEDSPFGFAPPVRPSRLL